MILHPTSRSRRLGIPGLPHGDRLASGPRAPPRRRLPLVPIGRARRHRGDRRRPRRAGRHVRDHDHRASAAATPAATGTGTDGTVRPSRGCRGTPRPITARSAGGSPPEPLPRARRAPARRSRRSSCRPPTMEVEVAARRARSASSSRPIRSAWRRWQAPSEVLSQQQVDRIVALLDPRQPLPRLAQATPGG